MRIISGKYKGKNLIAPKFLPVRPTTDFAKEALFNILNNQFDFENIEVLDLFSGTGNISFEFASRGTKRIRCIDQNHHCISYIKKISKELDFKQISAYKNNVFKYLKQYEEQFDLIFSDPPYNMENTNKIHELVFEKKLLKKQGWLIIEHDRNWNFSEYPNFIEQRNYGNVNFSIFEN